MPSLLRPPKRASRAACALLLTTIGCAGRRSPETIAAPAPVYGSGYTPADSTRVAAYLNEAAALCQRDGGALWGVSLCGPIAIVDPLTHAILANKPIPQAKRPPAFGYSNAAVDWGGTRWSTVIWQQLPLAEQGYGSGYLLMHELFHRIQPQLGLLLPDSRNNHLDELEGRYWVQLEWRALEAALSSAGQRRRAAIQDALGFRARRQREYASAFESERVAEINEGLAEYTAVATTAASGGPSAAARAIKTLRWALTQPTFVRAFAYADGAAYGVLLSDVRPQWTRSFKPSDDIATILTVAAHLTPTLNTDSAAAHYDGLSLRTAEAARDAERRTRLAALRSRFVDGPVLVLPRARSYSFQGNITPIEGHGSVYAPLRARVEWGDLDAESVLLADDGNSLTLPAPRSIVGSPIVGDGWTLTLAPGWRIEPGPRSGDYRVVQAPK